MTDLQVILYSKPRCGLCEKAKEALAVAGIGFEEIDITKDPGLQEEYGLLIPVVEVAGRIIFEAGMDAESLPSLIEQTALT